MCDAMCGADRGCMEAVVMVNSPCAQGKCMKPVFNFLCDGVCSATCKKDKFMTSLMGQMFGESGADDASDCGDTNPDEMAGGMNFMCAKNGKDFCLTKAMTSFAEGSAMTKAIENVNVDKVDCNGEAAKTVKSMGCCMGSGVIDIVETSAKTDKDFKDAKKLKAVVWQCDKASMSPCSSGGLLKTAIIAGSTKVAKCPTNTAETRTELKKIAKLIGVDWKVMKVMACAAAASGRRLAEAELSYTATITASTQEDLDKKKKAVTSKKEFKSVPLGTTTTAGQTDGAMSPSALGSAVFASLILGMAPLV